MKKDSRRLIRKERRRGPGGGGEGRRDPDRPGAVEREAEIISCEIMQRKRKRRNRGRRIDGEYKRPREKERGRGVAREVAARQEDINSVNAVIRANPKYRASIKHGSKIIICTG